MRPYARFPPCVNQLELHPWFQQRKLVEFCKKEKILLQAYSAIARNTHSENPELRSMAEKYKLSTAQLLLRYSLQKGYTPIVKATGAGHLYGNRQAENLVVSEPDIAALDSWDDGVRGSLCMSFQIHRPYLPAETHNSSLAEESDRGMSASHFALGLRLSSLNTPCQYRVICSYSKSQFPLREATRGKRICISQVIFTGTE
jgi:hypothetical protein